MNKKRLAGPLAAVAVLLALAAGKVSAAPNLLPNVGIIPFDAAGSMPNLASLASSLTDFLTIDFKISGRVVVKSLKRPAVEDFTNSIETIMSDGKLDYLLFGTVRGSVDGDVDITAYLVDSEGRRLSAGYRKLGSLTELTDAGDALYASLAKNVGSIHRGFGSIALDPSGIGGYDVYLNDELVGHGLPSVEDVLNGTYFVEVKQNRPFGALTLVSERITLGEGERANVKFVLPAVLPEEIAKVTDTIGAINQGWVAPSQESQVEMDIASLETAFSDISSCPGVGELAAKTRQYRGLWEARKLRYSIEESPLDFDPERLAELKGLYGSAAVYPDPEAIRDAVREDAAIAATLQVAKAIAAAGSGQQERAYGLYRAARGLLVEFEINLPWAYADDIAFLESMGDTYGPKAAPPKGPPRTRDSRVALGVGLMAVGAGLMAADVTGLMKDSMPASFPANLAASLGRGALIGAENVSFAGGLALAAFGRSANYREKVKPAQEAMAAARAHFGQRLADARKLIDSLAAPDHGPLIMVLSTAPCVFARVGFMPAMRLPFAVKAPAAGNKTVVYADDGEIELPAADRIQAVYARAPESAAPARVGSRSPTRIARTS